MKESQQWRTRYLFCSVCVCRGVCFLSVRIYCHCNYNETLNLCSQYFIYKSFTSQENSFTISDYLDINQCLFFSFFFPGLAVALQLLHGDIEQLRREYMVLFTRGVSITRKLGFSDIIMPGGRNTHIQNLAHLLPFTIFRTSVWRTELFGPQAIVYQCLF